MNKNNLTIVDRKTKAMQEIIDSFKTYKGNNKQTEISFFRCKLSEDDYSKLLTTFNDYENYILNILAGSQRVRVNFKQKQNLKVLDLDANIFEDLE